MKGRKTFRMLDFGMENKLQRVDRPSNFSIFILKSNFKIFSQAKVRKGLHIVRFG